MLQVDSEMENEAESILIIDDDDGVRRTFAAYLDLVGYRVLQAENGHVGLDMIRELKPSLILCDLRMPEIGGLELLEVAAREFDALPIILVSGEGHLNDAIQALKLGAWDYVTKPTRLPVLKLAIDRALERARLLRENSDYQLRLETTVSQLRASLNMLREDEEAGRRIQFQLLPKNDYEYEGYRGR